MRHRLLALALLAVTACASESPPVSDAGGRDVGIADTGNTDTGNTDTGNTDVTTPTDATPDVVPVDAGSRVSCLAQPTDLPRPPEGALPCELIPPSF